MMTPYPYQNPFSPKLTNSITWVQGIEGAKAFTLMPRENVVLMDSEVNDIFYIKICDDIGRCTLRKFKYYEEIEEPARPSLDMSQYVTKSELESILNERSKHESTVPATKTNTNTQSTGYDKQNAPKQS